MSGIIVFWGDGCGVEGNVGIGCSCLLKCLSSGGCVFC